MTHREIAKKLVQAGHDDLAQEVLSLSHPDELEIKIHNQNGEWILSIYNEFYKAWIEQPAHYDSKKAAETAKKYRQEEYRQWLTVERQRETNLNK